MKRGHDLVSHTAPRVSARAERFRATGHWGTEPVDLVRDAAGRDPARVAVAERGRSLTYGELDAGIDGAVAALQREGVGADDAVFVLTANDIVSVVAIHAVLRLGALVMVAPTSAGATQVRDIVAATEPSVVLAPGVVAPDRGPVGGAAGSCTDAIGAAEPPVRRARHRVAIPTNRRW